MYSTESRKSPGPPGNLPGNLPAVCRTTSVSRAPTCPLKVDIVVLSSAGLLLKEATQGGVLLGGPGRWTGDAAADRVAGIETPVKCSSPFLASSGAVCAATRLQVAKVCVALNCQPGLCAPKIGAPPIASHGFVIFLFFKKPHSGDRIL